MTLKEGNKKHRRTGFGMKMNFMLLCFLFPSLLFSQGEFNNWYFGQYAGITFNSGGPVALTNNMLWIVHESACISDSLGNLLFYSDGAEVYNRLQQLMPNGTGIICDLNHDQCVFAVKEVGDDSSYYLFTMNNYVYPYPDSTWGLRYSVINMRLDGGLGDVVSGQKNIPLMSTNNRPLLMTAIRQKNNRDIWLILHNSNANNNYLAYSITSAGINPVPVQSLSSFKHHLLYGLSSGSLRVSPDGQRLVFPCDDSVEYCNFNTLTGQATSLFRFTSTVGYEGLEFSIDSKYLYATTNESGGGSIYQFDATKTDSLSFVQSRVLIGNATYGCWLQRGPDHKIYGTEDGPIDSLCVINNPSSPGISCGFTYNSVSLSEECLNGFPQNLERYYVIINHTGECQWNPVNFNPAIWPQADSIHWDFGDPTSGSANYSNIQNPSHIYSNAGTYTVELYVRHIDNRTDTAWQTITILSNHQVSLGPDRTICLGDSITFDAGACSGCTYQWKNDGTGLVVGTNQTYKTGLAATYSVIVTSPDNCAGMDTVQLFTPPLPSVTNNPLSESICSGGSTNINLTSSVPGTNFHWTASLTSGNITGFSADSGLTINQVLINHLLTSGIVTYHITPNVGSCVGLPVDYAVTVTLPDSVKVSIGASQNNVCAGTSVTFTAVPLNGGPTPSYQWKVNGINSGTNSSTFTYTPVNNDVVTCVLSSSFTFCISNNPATSNAITMTINPSQPVSVTIAPSQNPVCAGNSVTFSATPTNGGLTPAFQWKVNGVGVGANNPIYSYIPNNGDIVTCVLTSNATCPTGNPASSNPVIMTVNPNLPVSITIVAASNPFCQGSSVTFTATSVNEGTSPAYQWQVNGVNVGVNNSIYTYNPLNGDLVSCVLTSSVACSLGNPASSNTITMIVNSNLPAGVTIVASSNPFCPGSSVTFTATPVNGGASPSYQWKVNGVNAGTNSHTFTYNPADGDSVRCVMTSNLSCVTGNPASSAEIIMSGTLSPIVTFTSCFDTITTVNAKPIKLKGGIPLGGTYSGPGVNSLTGVFTPSLAGTGTKTITYSYTNVVLCTASKSIHIIVQAAPVFTCGNNLTDIRDNKVYQTVQIGSQCWMASNLNFGTILASSQDQRDNCISEKYCYNDNPTNCANQGGLYQWDELMLYDNTAADQGFCPPGWHIPTENDWNTLFANYINNGFAGSPLKYSGYSGFNALLSGARHIDKSWDFQGFATFFWSSTAYGGYKAWAHGMNNPDPSVSIYPASSGNAFSVRCIKD
jgi:uncharacterized protein (TIGR02145 family)